MSRHCSLKATLNRDEMTAETQNDSKGWHCPLFLDRCVISCKCYHQLIPHPTLKEHDPFPLCTELLGMAFRSRRVSSSFKHNASFVSRLPTIRRHKSTSFHSPLTKGAGLSRNSGEVHTSSDNLGTNQNWLIQQSDGTFGIRFSSLCFIYSAYWERFI